MIGETTDTITVETTDGIVIKERATTVDTIAIVDTITIADTIAEAGTSTAAIIIATGAASTGGRRATDSTIGDAGIGCQGPITRRITSSGITGRAGYTRRHVAIIGFASTTM